jgi:endonuclease YncB( thermonuclease family)
MYEPEGALAGTFSAEPAFVRLRAALTLPVLATLLELFSPVAAALTLHGEVVAVADGDTLTVLDAN